MASLSISICPIRLSLLSQISLQRSYMCWSFKSLDLLDVCFYSDSNLVWRDLLNTRLAGLGDVTKDVNFLALCFILKSFNTPVLVIENVLASIKAQSLISFLIYSNRKLTLPSKLSTFVWRLSRTALLSSGRAEIHFNWGMFLNA